MKISWPTATEVTQDRHEIQEWVQITATLELTIATAPLIQGEEVTPMLLETAEIDL